MRKSIDGKNTSSDSVTDKNLSKACGNAAICSNVDKAACASCPGNTHHKESKWQSTTKLTTRMIWYVQKQNMLWNNCIHDHSWDVLVLDWRVAHHLANQAMAMATTFEIFGDLIYSIIISSFNKSRLLLRCSAYHTHWWRWYLGSECFLLDAKHAR